MKTEFRSHIARYGTKRLHIEIPAYVREDVEGLIGKKIKVTVEEKK